MKTTTKYTLTSNCNIQQTINLAVAERLDNETVELVFTAGVFETGPLTIYDNMILILEEGAIIKFFDDPNLYSPIWTRWEGVECYAMRPMLYASDANNITIQGKGIIDGSGQWWWNTFRTIEIEDRMLPREPYELALAKLNPNYRSRPGGGARPQTQFLRPPLVQFWRCNNIKLEGITLQNSPFWTLHIVYSKHILISGMKFLNPADAINTDAIDLDSSKHVLIENCLFDVGDDAITLKSGSGEDGLRINLPTKHVIAKNCKILASHGGVAIGSETAGGIEDVLVSECVFEGTQRAIRLKSRRGRGGTIKNITLSNLNMDGCWCPIVIGQYFAPGVLPHEREHILSTKPVPVTPMTPHIENITISNIKATNIRSTAAFIVGLPESPISNVVIENFVHSLADNHELLETWNTEPTEGLFHDEDRGVKVINTKNVKFVNK